MKRFKVTPVNIRNGNTAPYSIHEFNANKDLEAQAQEVSYLCQRFPNAWRPSISELLPCKIYMRGNRYSN